MRMMRGLGDGTFQIGNRASCKLSYASISDFWVVCISGGQIYSGQYKSVIFIYCYLVVMEWVFG